MLLTLRGRNVYSSARSTADSVISALSPAAWYRNATGVTSAGGFASQWDDYSGNGRHLVQGTGTNQPAYSAGVITFDGVDNHLVTSSWGMVQPETIVIVGKQVTWTANDDFYDGTTVNSALVRQFSSSPNIALFSGLGPVASNANLAVNTRGVVAAVFNGASSSLRVNNTTKTTGSAGTANMDGFRLGASSNLGGSQFSNIAVEEVVIFASALTDNEQDAVISALNNALTVF